MKKHLLKRIDDNIEELSSQIAHNMIVLAYQTEREESPERTTQMGAAQKNIDELTLKLDWMKSYKKAQGK